MLRPTALLAVLALACTYQRQHTVLDYMPGVGIYVDPGVEVGTGGPEAQSHGVATRDLLAQMLANGGAEVALDSRRPHLLTIHLACTPRTVDNVRSCTPFVATVGANGSVVDEFATSGKYLDPESNAGELVDLLEGSHKVRAAIASSPPAGSTSPRGASGGLRVAVLDFHNYAAELKPENVRYFCDVVRNSLLKESPKLDVMTRENLMTLLSATGKDLANCEGECEVDTGRRIGADLVVSGEIQKIGALYKLSMRLHDAHQGRLLGSAIGSAATVDELDGAAQRAAAELATSLR